MRWPQQNAGKLVPGISSVCRPRGREGFLQDLKITLLTEYASKFLDLGIDLFLTVDLMIEL